MSFTHSFFTGDFYNSFLFLCDFFLLFILKIHLFLNAVFLTHDTCSFTCNVGHVSDFSTIHFCS